MADLQAKRVLQNMRTGLRSTTERYLAYIHMHVSRTQRASVPAAMETIKDVPGRGCDKFKGASELEGFSKSCHRAFKSTMCVGQKKSG